MYHVVGQASAVFTFSIAKVAQSTAAAGQPLPPPPFDNDGMARVGTVSRTLLPTDGLWRGAMNSFQDPALLLQVDSGIGESPFLSMAPLTTTYLAWTVLWIAVVLGLAGVTFQRRDL